MTELIWEGKYDKDGRGVAPLRVALPFQTVETVNESPKERNLALDLFSSGRPAEWRNRLIWGDKKYVLPALLEEFAGKIDLIYIDPPFNVGADFSFTATIPDIPGEDPEGDETARFLKEPNVIEMKAYRDTWGRGLDSYLQWFYESLILLRELLTDRGTIFVHLDYHVGHYAQTVLDEAKRTVFNLVACDNDFEKTFAHFLKKAGDVASFAKLPPQFGFAIEYTDSVSNLRYYEPDFVVVLANGVHYLVETKGREDVDVAHKDRAAQIWCENATLLTGTPWEYLKVPQKDFEKLQPSEFADITVLRQPNLF